MIQKLSDFLKSKWKLEKMISIGGWGNIETEVIMVADTEQELIDYCKENDYDYIGSGGYSNYYICSPDED